MNSTHWFLFAFLAASSNAMAQQVTGAGGQIQQLPPAPVPQKSIPDMRVERRGAPAPPTADGVGALVRTLHVTGQTRFSEGELIAVAQFRSGAVLTLSDLRRMAQRITEYYSRHGYFVAQAYLPAQEIRDGAVTIAVIEGHYDKIALQNRARLWNGVPRGILAGLNSGDIVESARLERRLLLLSDIPGVQVHSTLSPGGPPGSSDLTVDIDPGRRISGNLEADNAGNRYTGAYRGGGTVNFNEPLGIGDVASLRVLTSGEGLNYVRGAYQAPLGVASLGAAYSAFWYRLGDTFSSLDADGNEQIASVYASYPLIRSRANNLYALADVDYRTFRDRIGLTSTVTDKRAVVGTIGFNGNHRDTLGGGGWDTYSLYGTFGDLDIRTPLARAADAATARSNGGYAKVAVSLDRLQTLTGPLSLYAAFRGQLASKNLDISEKMELGGAYGVRAYPEGEAYGDEGYIATVEARLALPKPIDTLPGEFQLIGFFDNGEVRSSKTPWFAGPNTLHRSGAGVGINWSKPNDYLISASYAFRLGDAKATSAPDRPGIFWFQVVKFF
ncbi:MAG: Polypeptide-transport-associated domain protein ShlB-type [Caulobacteraceae bacterium]|nr:Polypeptide-transport-associated domain protein ShlB-type [Caulobacteraceae bacterium]